MYNLCLCMIVKDEAHIITDCLNSVLKYIDYWVICDTGSTDNTEQIVKEFFSKHGIKGEYYHHVWSDFGHNRTLAFQAAYGKSKYVMCFDADDIFVGNFQLPKLVTNTMTDIVVSSNINEKGNNNINEKGNENVKEEGKEGKEEEKCDSCYDCYTIIYKHGNVVYDRNQIFRNDLKWIYRGLLHEFPYCIDKPSATKFKIQGDYYVQSRRLGARNRDPDKYKKDGIMLGLAIDKILSSGVEIDLLPRYYFYAGQSFFDYKDYETAIKYFTDRVNLGTKCEEEYMSYLNIGISMEHLNIKYPNDSRYSESSIIGIYEKGYNLIPQRAETLYMLGMFYKRKNRLNDAFIALSLASHIPYPIKHVLFILESAYTFGIKFELAIVCNLLGKFDISNNICQQLTTNITTTNNNNNVPEYNNNIKILVTNNNINRKVLKQYDFEDYFFFPEKSIEGYDVEGYNINKSHQPLLPTDLKKMCDDMNDCVAFTTEGKFKNVICGLDMLTTIPSNCDYLSGLYVKKHWKADKPILCFYTGNTVFECLSSNHNSVTVSTKYGSELCLIELAHELKKSYTVFILDSVQTDKVFIKKDGLFFSTIDYYLGLKFTTDILIISRYINYFVDYDLKPRKTFLWVQDISLVNQYQGCNFKQYGYQLLKRTNHCIDRIITLSNWHSNNFKQYYDINNNVIVIGLGYDPNKFQYTLPSTSHPIPSPSPPSPPSPTASSHCHDNYQHSDSLSHHEQDINDEILYLSSDEVEDGVEDTSSSDKFVHVQIDETSEIKIMTNEFTDDTSSKHVIELCDAVNDITVNVGVGVGVGVVGLEENVEVEMLGKVTNKIKHRFIWTSDFSRGIERLVDYFHLIRCQLPEAELHVYRDYSGYETFVDKNKCEYIFFHGWVSDVEVIKHFTEEADIWFYPTHFNETYCVSALQAQLTKTLCICTDLAGLRDTVGDRGLLLNINIINNKYLCVETVVNFINDYHNNHKLRQYAFQWASQQTWESKTQTWLSLFT